jgi:hypothetical protein
VNAGGSVGPSADPTIDPSIGSARSSGVSPPQYGDTSPRTDWGDTSTVSIWISLVVGVICVLMGLRFIRWAIVTTTGGTFSTGVNWVAGPKAGEAVDYWQLDGFAAHTELGFFAMGGVLLLDALLMMSARQGRSPGLLLGVAIICTGACLLYNLGLAIYLITLGVTPLWSLVVVLIAGIVLFTHLETARSMSREDAARAHAT